jgi:hypothetical protein
MKLYLSGAITKDTDYKIKFKKAENHLKKLGYEVINPVELCYNITGYVECMKLDIQEMLKCDCVVVIENDIESLGREIEIMVAEAVYIPVMTLKEMELYYTPLNLKHHIMSRKEWEL